MPRMDPSLRLEKVEYLLPGKHKPPKPKGPPGKRGRPRTRMGMPKPRELSKEELLRLEASIGPGELGKLAKARLHKKLLTEAEGDPKELGYIRTAMETDGLLGGPSELHLHNHAFPPAAQKMMMDMMLSMAKKQGLVLEAENGASIPERAESAD